MTPRSGISGYADGRRKFQCAIGLVLLFFATLVPAVFAQPAATKAPRTILVMGDSLSAAYGLSASQGWVALTAERMGKSHPGWKMVNASISGETTAGGAARIDAELKRHRPAVVVIELGANDGLRGLGKRGGHQHHKKQQDKTNGTLNLAPFVHITSYPAAWCHSTSPIA